MRPRLTLRSVLLLGLLGLAFQQAENDEVFRYDEEFVPLEVNEWLSEPPDGWHRERDWRQSTFITEAIEDRPGVLVGFATSAQKEGQGIDTLVVWDEFDPSHGTNASFDVYGRWNLNGEWQEPFLIAGGPRFQVRPAVVVTDTGALDKSAWVAWEEGPENWGREYRSVDRLWNNPTDERGPLHSWRAVRLARVDLDGGVREVRVPMPLFKEQAAREDTRDHTARLGVFYESPSLYGLLGGGVCLAYRHMHAAQLSTPDKTRTHVEEGYAVEARVLVDGEWSDPWRLPVKQREGDQRLRLWPRGVTREQSSPVSLIAEVGREDRRAGQQRRAWAEARIPIEFVGHLGDVELSARRLDRPATVAHRPHSRPTCESEGDTYTLCFGDLHRHTDRSLCFPFYDGSLDDAYRYARGPAALDFVGITDHARDLDRGDVDGTPWARTVAAADQHHAPGEFVAFYSYERSQGNTDHNVISLRPDVLRPHTPPLKEFWQEWSPEEVITIPHATSWRPGARFCGDVWQKRDDARRPIAEIYQAYRDVSSMDELCRAALGTGQRLGFIASSDHLATSGAYACVWAAGGPKDALDRRPIFDALRARRTYAATARIELRVTCGDRWMGEELDGLGPHELQVDVKGTGPIARIEFRTGTDVTQAVSLDGASEGSAAWTWSPDAASEFAFVRIVQEDGQRAWSSPFFVTPQ